MMETAMGKTRRANVAKTPVSAGWISLESQLANTLQVMQEDQFLIISVKQSNRFIQFAAQGAHGLRAEVTSNVYLSGAERWTEAQLCDLKALGWLEPTGSPETSTPERDPDGSANFICDFRSPILPTAIAKLSVDTLMQVMHVPYPEFLEYEAFDNERNTDALPNLGLKRTIRDPEIKMSVLSDRLLRALQEATGLKEIEYGEDGEVGFQYLSATVFVRLLGQPPNIRFASALITDLAETDKLLRRLNEINAQFGGTYFVVRNGAVFAVNEIPAWPFIAEHVAQSLHQFSDTVAAMDDFLEAEFGDHADKFVGPMSIVAH